jgi:NhaP-type Na+/H+ and K+/H+ antiporter
MFLVIIRTVAFDTMYYGMVVSYNEKTSKITYMTLHLATRETKLLTVQMNSNKLLLNKYVPDVEIKDMTVLVQLIADGNLLDQPPATTINLERGVKKIMTRVNKHIVTEDHLQNQQLNEKYHQQPESEALDM